jgi:hypothetical protein
MKKSKLEEGLRAGDLRDLVENVFSIDTYKSKMGEDKDVAVLTFTVKDRLPAKDLMEFIEKNYDFVLDADISSGENDRGDYFLFVEMLRSKDLPVQVLDILDGTKKLTGINEWSFKYYKNKNTYQAVEENFAQIVPLDSSRYDFKMNEHKTNEIKGFFSKTLFDDITLNNNIISIKKPFGVSLNFELVDEDINLNESSPNVDDSTTAEIFWLTKVLGDYDISKYEDNLVLQNNNKTLILQRRF